MRHGREWKSPRSHEMDVVWNLECKKLKVKILACGKSNFSDRRLMIQLSWEFLTTVCACLCMGSHTGACVCACACICHQYQNILLWKQVQCLGKLYKISSTQTREFNLLIPKDWHSEKERRGINLMDVKHEDGIGKDYVLPNMGNKMRRNEDVGIKILWLLKLLRLILFSFCVVCGRKWVSHE